MKGRDLLLLGALALGGLLLAGRRPTASVEAQQGAAEERTQPYEETEPEVIPITAPELYKIAAGSNLGTQYAGWEKLGAILGEGGSVIGVRPKPGMDWAGPIPSIPSWLEYEKWKMAVGAPTLAW